MSHMTRGLATRPRPSAGWLLGLALLMSPTTAHACTGGGMFRIEGLMPYFMLLPVLWLLKVALYALAGEGWLFKDLAKAAGVPVIGGAFIAVVELPSLPYFVAAVIGIFTIFSFGDLKYFREKYAGRPPMRVRHALFWGNLLFSFFLLFGFGFFSQALQGCIG